MLFLTATPALELEHINKILKTEGMKEIATESGINRLGEGAWHFAYLIEEEQLVLRIPKKIAYEKEVLFNEKALREEYAATLAFYQHANKVKKGICPEHFKFRVKKDMTYTMESYMGDSAGLSQQTTKESKQYGRELGMFFRALESVKPPYKGIGYLEEGENGELRGKMGKDLHAFLLEESREYEEELQELVASPYEFNKEKVIKKAECLLLNRSVDKEQVVLTNQDTSPENILFTQRGAKMIDPFPLLYSGTSLAANHLFNYQTLFPTFYNTIRYGKGNYDRYIPQLAANAKGFMEGYTAGSRQKHADLHVEVFLKLLTMSYTHLQLLKEEVLNREQVIRFGTKAQVEERLLIYLKKLEGYPLF
ncbi:hypothetical protein ERJ70_05750 [Sediminibacillus dalangtanensis]|uniref:Phosphotransferase enzyme family protein n=1 Tax=Sediminibacillus dalangtanensis TaxID=2729421 RepID=A0ABX7VQQ7_9BACI|nr:hypothetical protein [Sediminibacillus dalangtanensis]QTM98843.1 hypothetical protein ERJ70_05750 [Sediminibacillus dalangtanensis]